MTLPALTGTRARALALVLALAVFATDLALSLHVAHGLLYIPVVLITLWSDRVRDPLLAGLVCTVLSLTGWLIGHPAVPLPDSVVALNRGLSLAALWVTTLSVHSRRRAETQLADREERLRLMADALPVLISYVGHDFRYRYANSRYREWFGTDPAMLPGTAVCELIGDAPWSRMRPFAERALAGEAVSFDGRLSYSAAGERDVHIDFVPHRGEEGAVLGFYTMVADVSRAKRIERELRDGEAALRAVFDTTTDAIVTVRSGGTITTFNHAAEQMFGYSTEEALGHDIRILLPAAEGEEDGDAMGRLLDEASEAGRSTGAELLCRRRDGTSFPVELGVCAWRDDVDMHTLVLRDVSERRELQAEVQQSQRLEAVGRFAGAIAHDFNNLLMGILGCCRIAARSLAEATPERAQLEEIHAAAERGASLTRQLLAFSRRKDIESAAICLDEVVRGAEALVRSLVGEDTRLELELRAGEQAVVAAPGQIEQVLLNLVSNARDAMPGCGRLSIRTGVARCGEPCGAPHEPGTSGPHVELEVADTGCGMTPETRAHAFEPFFTTKPVTEGTGLGLSTVYGIVRQLGGHVHLESEPGEGTTLRVHMTAAEALALPAEETPAAAAAPADPAATGGGETILVVEDDRLVRAGLRHLLEDEGYRVLLASDGAEALRVSAEHEGRVDLLLTDIIMPGMGGAELERRLTGLEPSLEALFMSALPGDVLVEQGRLDAGRPTIQKPFDEAELLGRLRELLAARSKG